jgi:hypothetical protein
MKSDKEYSKAAGCVAVTDIGRWDSIHRKLIRARKDSYSVGTVNVLDQ